MQDTPGRSAFARPLLLDLASLRMHRLYHPAVRLKRLTAARLFAQTMETYYQFCRSCSHLRLLTVLGLPPPPQVAGPVNPPPPPPAAVEIDERRLCRA